MSAIHVLCPAKINLTLEILGKRPDGYHELRTIFQAVSLYDELTVTPAARDSLTVTGLAGAPADETNLCLRALELVRQERRTDLHVAVALHKRIPTQAGLGGGSSDAAGMLAALAVVARFIAPDTPRCASGRDESRHCAARLGSDVAFFLHGGAMVGAGRGEVLEPVAPLSAGGIVLAKPEVGVGTAQAYGLITPRDYTDGGYTARCAACLQAGCALPEVAPKLYNAFAGPIERLDAGIAAVRQRLLTLHAQAALLCGSGAAVFGLYDDFDHAERSAAVLRGEGLWAEAVRPVAHGLRVTQS